MILCLARLGLRAGEVARIELDDVDWRSGILTIRTRKTGRGARLPLPNDVARALVAYLRRGRPATSARSVFVLHHLRVGAPAEARTVCDAVREALDRAGIRAPIHGPYVLRHTFATHLIQRGASSRDRGHSGHRSIATTQIYANLDALRTVASPWPEVAS
jgi:site-specific recombinase XerD